MMRAPSLCIRIFSHFLLLQAVLRAVTNYLVHLGLRTSAITLQVNTWPPSPSLTLKSS